MKADEVRKNAFAMLLTSSAYPPGPYSHRAGNRGRSALRQGLDIITLHIEPNELPAEIAGAIKARPHARYRQTH